MLSILLVLDNHQQNCHIKGEQILSSLRESVWITKCKALMGKVIQNCSFRKRRPVTPQPPIMGYLPESCLAINGLSFTTMGIDYFGPLTIKQGGPTPSPDGTSKKYGAIFTCLSTRAVHIKLIPNLPTDNFILTLHRLISRRGHPKNIFSGNRTNFAGAQRELDKPLRTLDQERIRK